MTRRDRLIRYMRNRALWHAFVTLAAVACITAAIDAAYVLAQWWVELMAHVMSGWRLPR